MKLDRYNLANCNARVKHVCPVVLAWMVVVAMSLCMHGNRGIAQPPTDQAIEHITPEQTSSEIVSQPNPGTNKLSQQSQPQAVALLRKAMEMVVLGPAFDAKVRETVWTTGRKVVGVGTYEQAGGGSGRFNLQVIMHDGDGKHRLQQISDGRLAWTRSEVAGKVSLRRVDVGRLDQWVQGVSKSNISPGQQVGAWAEMLSQVERDYVLQVNEGKLKEEPVWVVSGRLRKQKRDEIMAESKRETWPELHPTRVMIAIQSQSNPETGFGKLLPVRMEFWSSLSDSKGKEKPQPSEAIKRDGRLITLVELYSIRPINPPPVERFRFENHDAEVNFVNETDRYIQSYGVELTERQRRQLMR